MVHYRKGGCVYILTCPDKTALYTGVSSQLENRVVQHREKANQGSFSARYNCNALVYFRYFETIEEAIAEEKRIKGGSRAKKIALIESLNPYWRDLWHELDTRPW